jgi:peroxiredoxin
MISKIKNGQIIPRINLSNYQDGNFSTDNLWQKKNLIIFFFAKLDLNIKRYLIELNSAYELIKEQNAELLAVSGENDKGLIREFIAKENIKFDILFDKEGLITDKFLIDKKPILFITDRFFSLYRAYEQLPQKEEVLSSLEFLEKQCPECGVSHWEDNL